MAGATTGKKIGRPTTYSQELGDLICAQIAEGKSLKRICTEEKMPSRQTVFSWFRTYKEFLDNYTRAKEESADAYAEDIEDIAHEVRSGKLDPQAARVAGDLLKWTSSKLKPKKYGNQIDVTSDGKVLPTPIIALANTSSDINE